MDIKETPACFFNGIHYFGDTPPSVDPVCVLCGLTGEEIEIAISDEPVQDEI